ncbi:hypothetical protein SynNOUM97013_00752 [Synechococcus sp. NOUM97013]|nr:hypothetical protein SynNOUM97013_00752 [Synechococcus sp. NOUM97013]
MSAVKRLSYEFPVQRCVFSNPSDSCVENDTKPQKSQQKS